MNELIKKTIIKNLDNCSFTMIILFGSHARNEATKDSDYDILVIVKDGPTVDEIRCLQRNIRKEFALMDIDADILVRTEEIVHKFKDKQGNVIYEAMREGIAL